MKTSNKIALIGVIASIILGVLTLIITKEDTKEAPKFEIMQTIQGNTNAIINKTININVEKGE